MPDAADLVAAADTLQNASMFAEAVTTYTKAIELAPHAPQYYIKRYLPSFIALLILALLQINALEMSRTP
jgi:hypothetical protein